MDLSKHLTLGYYKVGDAIHTSKISALIDGTTKNIHPEWVFNNTVFDTVDWTVEPSESLSQLYFQRAKQIRETYDYVALMFSGGADSTNILNTFINNNLRIDEIIVSWPQGLKNTYKPNQDDFSWTNMLSEWDFVIEPKLKWLATYHPEIKITVHDWVAPALQYKIQDDYMLSRSSNFTPFASAKWDYNGTSWFGRVRDKVDKFVLVLGTDKPRICFQQNAYRLFFLDLACGSSGPQTTSDFFHDNLQVELFYWSPSCTKMLAKQAHELVKFFEVSPQFKTFITWPQKNPRYRQWYETSVRPIIYPDVDLSFFQADKAPELTLSWDKLLYRVGLDKDIIGMTDANFNYLRKIIDSKYFTTTPVGTPSIIGFITGMWPVKYM